MFSTAPLGLVGVMGSGQTSLLGSALLGAAVPTPFPVLRGPQLRTNIAEMASYCRKAGVELAPHVKTTMSPTIARWQLDAGARGLTVATVGQARLLHVAGFRHLLIAMQVVQAPDLGWIAARLADGDVELSCFVDSVEGVDLMAETLGSPDLGRPLPVLLEVGLPGGRTGCRTDEDIATVVAAVRAAPGLTLVGVAGFEGIITRPSPEARLNAVLDYLHRVRQVTERLLVTDAFDPTRGVVVTAGGTAFFAQVAQILTGGWPGRAHVTTVLRSGCYVTHDAGPYQRALEAFGGPGAPALRPALQVWGTVISHPEPHLAFLDVGRRHVSADAGLPLPRWRSPRDSADCLPLTCAEVVALNDQHAYLRLDDTTSVQIGDRVGLEIAHPCTTLDKWRQIPIVDDRYRVIDTVDACFGILDPAWEQVPT